MSGNALFDRAHRVQTPWRTRGVAPARARAQVSSRRDFEFGRGMARDDAEEGARTRAGAGWLVRNDLAHPAAHRLHRGRPGGVEVERAGTSRLPRRISLYTRRPADGVPRPLVDHASVRWLRIGRGV